MRYSRRAIVGTGIDLAGIAFLRPWDVRGQDVRFADDPFTLGIASGYPGETAVVLWTRLAPQPWMTGGGVPFAPVEVTWEIGSDDQLLHIVRTGSVYATPDLAHSVHVEVTGLEPARDYWYRFTSGGQQSEIGRTRTAPAFGSSMDRFTIAVASCQYYELGHYAAYRAIAADALDLVVHVGDYIYEAPGIANVRSHNQPECHTLEDYRQRYAIYKADPHLKAAHAASPWMVVPDDHEVANDYAGEHSSRDKHDELFLARRAAAYQAYYEHLPLPHRFAPFAGHQIVFASRSFGDLVSLYMLDGRQYRSRQACAPVQAVEPCPELSLEGRTMLGPFQELWLHEALRHSVTRWNLLAQQTLFSHFDQSGDQPPLYYADTWNGYPAARARLIQSLLARPTPNPVILSGDLHAFLVNDVNVQPVEFDSTVIATEFVTSSISSPGLLQHGLDKWREENPNVRLARSDYRGYVRLAIAPEQLHADLIAVDDVTRADSPTHVLASFDVESGRPGVAR